MEMRWISERFGWASTGHAASLLGWIRHAAHTDPQSWVVSRLLPRSAALCWRRGARADTVALVSRGTLQWRVAGFAFLLSAMTGGGRGVAAEAESIAAFVPGGTRRDVALAPFRNCRHALARRTIAVRTRFARAGLGCRARSTERHGWTTHECRRARRAGFAGSRGAALAGLHVRFAFWTLPAIHAVRIRSAIVLERARLPERAELDADRGPLARATTAHGSAGGLLAIAGKHTCATELDGSAARSARAAASSTRSTARTRIIATTGRQQRGAGDREKSFHRSG